MSGPGVPRPGRLPDDPDDPDTQVHRSVDRPAHLRPGLLGLVFVGGMIGTLLRAGLGLVLTGQHLVPLATGIVNVLGAFCLGLLQEVLTRGGPDEGRRRALRLLLGTGMLGGFTTYSALATEVALGLGSRPVALAAYALGTLVLGGAASLAGILLGGRLLRHPEGVVR